MRGKRQQNQPQSWKEDYIKAFQNQTEEPVGLMEFMQRMMPDAKRNQLKSWLKYNQVMINGVVTRQFDEPVNPGQWVEINLTRPFVVFSHPPMTMIYEDDHIIVVNKGYGLLSMGTDSAHKDETAYSILKDYVKQKHPMNKIFIVHRLDRDTSGLMMFAKSEKIQEQMQRGWHKLVLDRRYVAVIEGALPHAEGVIDAPLTQDRNHKMWVTRPGEGEDATTYYTTLRRGKEYSLVDLRLVTGKKNQIRAHLEWKGTPIAGDKKYHAKTNPAGRVCLHAYKLSITHPTTGQELHFDTRIPKLFEECVK